MTKPRPCGCKGCRTCLICETQYGADKMKLQLDLDKNKGYVYCPFCNKAWQGWDMDLYKQHPHHEGDCIDYPGVYIQLEFITEDEEIELVKNIDEMPWDISQSGRRKQNFGPKTNFKKRKVVLGKFEGFPEFSRYLQNRLKTIDLLKDYEVIEQCSLEYDPNKGASIDPHIDDCWIWGERIVTLNCLSDSILTMVRYKGDIKKYNIDCSMEFPSIVSKDGSIIMTRTENELSAYENCKPTTESDVIVRIPMPRRSLLLFYGEPRYHWQHFILREDVPARRVCIAYREFTPPYMVGGVHQEIGDVIRNKAKLFWNHLTKLNSEDEIDDQ